MISANSGGTFTTYTYDYRNRLTGGDAGRHGHRDLHLQCPGPADRHPGERRLETWTVYNGTSADALPYGDFNGSGTLADALRLRAGDGQRCGRRRAARADELGGNDGVVLDRQAGFGAGRRELGRVGDSITSSMTASGTSRPRRMRATGIGSSLRGWNTTRRRAVLRPRAKLRLGIGRFTALDPAGFNAGDPDLYRYVRCSPTNRVDTSGMDSESENQAGIQAAQDRLQSTANLNELKDELEKTTAALEAMEDDLVDQEQKANQNGELDVAAGYAHQRANIRNARQQLKIASEQVAIYKNGAKKGAAACRRKPPCCSWKKRRIKPSK